MVPALLAEVLQPVMDNFGQIQRMDSAINFFPKAAAKGSFKKSAVIEERH